MALPTPMLLLSALLIGLLCSPASAEETTSNVLFNDHGRSRLLSGESLKNDQFRLIMQPDCNLVLLEFLFPTKRGGIRRWMSNTTRIAPFGCYLEVSRNGTLDINERLFSGNGRRIWSCGTPAKVAGRYALVLRADGRFSTYGPRFWRLDARLPLGFRHRGVFYSGYDKTGEGTIVRSGGNELLIDGSNRLVIQIYGPDGNVTFRHDVSPEHAFRGQPNLEFTTSGELVYSDLVVGGSGNEIKRRVWGSGVTSNAVEYISALPDLGIYGIRELIYNSATGKAICGVAEDLPRYSAE